ncbi:MAG: hypothetical protein MUE77_02865 [Sandarakinorhabdus sp.]|jgi:hypothetical protein|nr:hypothetical protein [Sandarakinorhabdus sp.]
MRSVSLFLVLAVMAAPAVARDKGVGLVTQNNIAAMTVDLTPSYAGVKLEGSAGTQAEGAVSRYRAGKVKPLLPLSGRSAVGAAGVGGGGGQGGGGGGERGGQN